MYTITYEGMDSAMFEDGKTNPTTYTVETETFTLNNPTRKGYKFAGWTGTNLDQVSKEVTIAKGTTGALSYTANWAIEQRGVTLTGGTGISGFEYRVNGGGLKTFDQQATILVLYGSTLEIKAIAAPGYRFTKWDDGETKNPRTLKANEAVTLEASADAVEYAIAYELGGALKAGETNPETYTVETTAFMLKNLIRTGYVFTGWTGSNGTTPQTTVTIIPNKNKLEKLSYTANWMSAEKYTPTLKMEGGANFIVGMATEDAIARIGEGMPNFGAANFKSVDLDGKPIDPKFYQVRNGSIILTIEKAFLNTLSAGEHALNVQLKDEGYEGQTVSGQIVVSPVPDASHLPKTGDDSPR
ncbi:InlB B-repeat-containing protein [Hominenteromicrobium sp.]|uniref:InlB B-repeat-containing protein n=1 Tax=Hominenteromicrobium sp. TaxID=3073581 RepID=UPI003A945410